MVQVIRFRSAEDSTGTVLIAGGGIGGLPLAIALRCRGIEARVFERASKLEAIGAGITVQSNAMRALRPLGLDEAVAREGQVGTRARCLDDRGRVLSEVDLTEVARVARAPVVTIHRARLQAVLREACGELMLGAELTGFREDGAEVIARFGEREERGSFLVGADGLHSRTRRELFGDDPLHYAGYTVWRGVCARADLVPEGVTTESWGRGARFGIVPIGQGQVYWFAVLNAPEDHRESPGRAREAVLTQFGSWHAPIRALVEATDEGAILRHDIFDRAPIPRWSRGRVTLLGDAAHPMTPNLGQGGCQAIEDAVALAEELERGGGEALVRYERRRLARAYRFVRTARQFGQVGQWEHPFAVAIRDLLVRMTPDSVATASIARELAR
jgi:2-polyprenyl-6-methoxyphenol hydroxylase-like FAD-dependent oxidoreductase